MLSYIPTARLPNGSTRGFSTVDPERQGMLVGWAAPLPTAGAPKDQTVRYNAGQRARPNDLSSSSSSRSQR